MKLHTDKENEGSMAVIPRFSSPSSSLFSLDILANTPPSFPPELSSSSQKNSPSPTSLETLVLSQAPPLALCQNPLPQASNFSLPLSENPSI